MPIRNLALAMLGDENGISESVWNLLADLLKKEGADGSPPGGSNNEDILDMVVETTDGRFYLPQAFFLKG